MTLSHLMLCSRLTGRSASALISHIRTIQQQQLISRTLVSTTTSKSLKTDLRPITGLLNVPCNVLNKQPARTSSTTDHAKLWSLEKFVSAGLLAAIPAAFIMPNPAFDYLLALSLVAHVHWGLEAIAVDYIRPSLFGTTVPKFALLFVYLASALSLAGLFYFNYADVGLAQAFKMFLQKK